MHACNEFMPTYHHIKLKQELLTSLFVVCIQNLNDNINCTVCGDEVLDCLNACIRNSETPKIFYFFEDLNDESLF